MSLFQVLELVAQYFGSAEAERFLVRQYRHPLRLAPGQPNSQELRNLAYWVMISDGMIASKEKMQEITGKALEAVRAPSAFAPEPGAGDTRVG